MPVRPPPPPADDRLAEALRANLRRRKAARPSAPPAPRAAPREGDGAEAEEALYPARRGPSDGA